MSRGHNLPNIRTLLTEGFTTVELRRLCYDALDFRPVYDQSSPELNKAEIIDRLLEHADRKLLLDTLLLWLKKYNPARYEQHQPYYESDDTTTSPQISSLISSPSHPYTASSPPSLNPFGETGCLTDPNRFFNREKLLRQIFEELRKGVNLSLVGESQIGKSSLLTHVCVVGPQWLGLSSEAFAYVNLEWVDNEDDFYIALCDALGITTCRGYQLIRALRGKRYLLCLDEIEKMSWDGFTVRLRSHLRGLADGGSAPLKLVIASRSPLAHLFPDSPELDSPLAGICRQIDVLPFSLDVARAFLNHRLQGTGITFTSAQIDTLLFQTNGHPAKLQHAAAELYHLITQKAAD